MFEIHVPEFGESIQEVQVGQWLKEVGQWVERDEEFVELESDKATQALPAPEAGFIREIKVETGGFAKVGDLLCVMEAAEEPGGGSGGAAAPAQATESSAATQSAQGTAPSNSESTPSESASFIMPAAQRVLDEYNLSAEGIPPSGPGGRLQKEDVLNHIQQHGLAPGGESPASTVPPPDPSDTNPAERVVPAVAPPAADPMAALPVGSADAFTGGTASEGISNSALVSSEVPASRPSSVSRPSALTPSTSSTSSQPKQELVTQMTQREEKTIPMSMIRRTIANRLVEAQQNAALLTTFNEIDMKPVMELRTRYKEAFLKKHDVKLGFMSFFAKAVVESLKRFPAVNSEVQGTNVIWKNYFDIGVAIGGGKGLVVPVLRNVEHMSFADIEQKIGEYAKLAMANKIKPADLQGGTFTISNGGVYGSLLSTPIVNPPQSGILGLHSIQERPIALNGEVVIRPMMYVALTYDHRIVDGREAVGFLKTIKEVLEEPARMFLEV